jgi:hypothetical protein
MIALTDSSSSTCSAAASFFAKLPIEILQHIAGYLVPKKVIFESEWKPLLDVMNLFEAYPSVFPFLKCFKDISDAGIARCYPSIFLYEDSTIITTELLESLIQAEPQKLSIYHKKYFSTILFAQFRKRTEVCLWLSRVNLTSYDINQIVLALQSKNNNITYVNLFNSSIKVNDLILLAKALEHKNNRVDSLVIDCNEINFEGTKTLANALIHPNCKLSFLSLRSNWIGWDRYDILTNAVSTVRSTREFTYTYQEKYI